MTSFALFRLPYEQQYTLIAQTSGEPLEVSSFAELSGKQGFVVAPFAQSEDFPILLIRPDMVSHDIPSDVPDAVRHFSVSEIADVRVDYQIDFANFHAHLTNGDFSKLVLTRSLFVASDMSS